MGKITNEAFDAKLVDLLDEYTGEMLLSIPGVYEVLAEHLNNAVLEALEEDGVFCDEGDEQ